MNKLNAFEVKGVQLHYGLTAYAINASNNWSFLTFLRDAQGQLNFIEEPSTQVKAIHAKNSLVSSINAANEAARVLFDHKVKLADGYILVLFLGQELVGAYIS